MSPLIEITAVGALIRPVGGDRSRPYRRGDHVEVSEDQALRYVSEGTANIVEDDMAEDAEAEQPQPGAIDLDAMTVGELRRFADQRRIQLGAAQKRADVVEAIEVGLEAEDA